MVNYVSTLSWPPANRLWPSTSAGGYLRSASTPRPSVIAAFRPSAPALAPFSPSTSVLRLPGFFLYLLAYCSPAPPPIHWAFIEEVFP